MAIELKSSHVLNIDKVRDRTKNQISRIGVELEGGWNNATQQSVLAGIIRDGSVNFPGDVLRANNIVGVGELPSTPLELSAWKPWVKKHYPTITNHTCGMHVHMSFKTALTYQRLMTPRYPATVAAYFGRWASNEKLNADHPLWDRLRGNSRYCKLVFDAADQVQATSKDYDRQRPGNRYTIVNYCHNRTETLECRLLPMMDNVDQALRAIQEVIDITNAFLMAYRDREKQVSAKMIAEDQDLKDILNIRV